MNLYRTSQKYYSKSDLVVTLFQSIVHGKQFSLLSHRQDIDSSWHRLTGISCNFPLKKNSWENTCIGLVHVYHYWRYAGSLPLPLTQLNSCVHIHISLHTFHHNPRTRSLAGKECCCSVGILRFSQMLDSGIQLLLACVRAFDFLQACLQEKKTAIHSVVTSHFFCQSDFPLVPNFMGLLPSTSQRTDPFRGSLMFVIIQRAPLNEQKQ